MKLEAFSYSTFLYIVPHHHQKNNSILLFLFTFNDTYSLYRVINNVAHIYYLRTYFYMGDPVNFLVKLEVGGFQNLKKQPDQIGGETE